jgi:hypothetical protein
MSDSETLDQAFFQVEKQPEYQDWVAKDGLKDFAAAHNVEPNFMDRPCEAGVAIVLAFYDKLSTVPGLEAEMAPSRDDG